MISKHVDIVAVGVLLLAILIFSEARKSIWLRVIKNPARFGVEHMYIRMPEPPLPPVVIN